MIRGKPKIEFSRLEIHNFGPYKGKHIVEFSSDPKKNVTLIEADQGTGKTSVFQLIWWLLFPKEKNDENDKEFIFFRSPEVTEAINKLVIKETKIDGEIKIGGIIDFDKYDRSGNKVNYLISRFICFIKKKDGLILKGGSMESAIRTVIYQDSQQVKDIDWIYDRVVNDFFPKAVRDFVFIFGEGLTKLLSMENVGKIKDDALDISDKPRLDALIRYLEDCEAYFNKHRKNQNKDIKKLDEIQNDIDEIIGQKDEKQRELLDAQDKKEECRTSVTNARNQLGKVRGNIEFIKAFRAKMNKKEILEKSRDNIIERREKIFLNNLPLLYLENAFLNIRNDLTKKRENDIIPGKITAEMLSLILERKNDCVCGEKWTNTMKEKIDQLIKLAPGQKSIESIIKFESKLDEKISEIEDSKISILEIQKELVEINRQITDVNIEIKNLKQKIPAEEQKEEWYQDIIDLEGIISRGDQLIGGFNETIKHKIEELNGIEGKLKQRKETYKKEETKIEKTTNTIDYSKYIDQIDFLKKITKEMISLVSNKIRVLTQKEILVSLKKLARDPDNWKEVKIDDQETGWIIRAVNINDSVLTNISTGQTNIVGTAFIYTLSNILDIDLPLIIDSPFVNIDLKTREAVIHNLPIIYEGRQLIFFAKKTELLGPIDPKTERAMDLYPVLKEFIGIEYEIENPTMDNASLTRR